MPSLVEFGPLVLKNFFLYFTNVFLQFSYYLHLKKGVTLHLNKHEFPPPKDATCMRGFG